MILLDRHMKFLTIALLVVQLCLPVYGPAYFFEVLNNIEASNSGFVCNRADAESGRESHEGHQHIHHCHELNAPCEIASSLVLGHSPVISTLSSSEKGSLLPGYGAPIDIPPENRV